MLTRPISCELRLERPSIFLGSPQGEEGNTCVTGCLTLHFKRPTLIKSIKVQLRGTLKVHRDKDLIRNNREIITFDVTKSLAISETRKPFKLQQGYHQFRFEIPIDKPLFETLDGLDGASHSYEVRGIIERSWSHQQTITKSLCIYGKHENSWLTPSEYDPLVRQNTLNGVYYEITLPAQNIPFGAIFPAHIRLSSDIKLLQVKHIIVKVIETQTFKIPATAFEQTHFNIRFLRSQKTRLITGDEKPLLPSAYSAPDTVVPGTDWEFTSTLDLPRQLQGCTQTMRLPYLDIKHFISVEIALQMTDDLITISEAVPFRIFMPGSPVDGAIGAQIPQMRLRENWAAPPPYGKHQSDLLLVEGSVSRA